MHTQVDPAIQLYQTLGPWLSGAAAALLLLGVIATLGIWISLARTAKALKKQAESQRYQTEILKWIGQVMRDQPPLDAAALDVDPTEAAVTHVSTAGASLLGAVPAPDTVSLRAR